MVTGGFLFFLKRVGYFVKDNWPYVLAFIGAVVLFVFVAVWFNSCGGNTPPVFTPESLNKINAAESERIEKVVREEIEKNAEAKRAVGDRTANAESDAERNKQEVDEKARKAAEKVKEARNQGRDVTAEELECIVLGNC